MATCKTATVACGGLRWAADSEQISRMEEGTHLHSYAACGIGTQVSPSPRMPLALRVEPKELLRNNVDYAVPVR